MSDPTQSPPLRGFILAAGFGKRMGVLTADCPKPLLPFQGAALIDHSLFFLEQLGLNAVDIVVNLHYRAAQLDRHLPSECRRSIEEPHILGTAGAIREALARELIGRDDLLLLTNPDTLTIINEKSLIRLRSAIDSAVTEMSRSPEAVAALALLPQPPDSTEPGFRFLADIEGKRQLVHSSPFPQPLAAFESAASHYYIGVAIVRVAALADLPRATVAELGPHWRAAAASSSQLSPTRLLGFPYPSETLDLGKAESYLAACNLSAPLYRGGIAQKWKTFLEKRH